MPSLRTLLVIQEASTIVAADTTASLFAAGDVVLGLVGSMLSVCGLALIAVTASRLRHV